MESLKVQNDQINRLSKNMEEAIQNALECGRVATFCLQHCLSMGGKHGEQRHITLLKECSDITKIAISFMIENSDFSHDICGICARICDACADSCHDLDPHDSVMEDCIIACRKCADSCRNMEH
ncbi:MAG: four-helix bundle copper-binding protein [Bdellovibrionales bacterium]|nr:four-helix bundle copper-binding protein [Bdellovibrionales bacterium]